MEKRLPTKICLDNLTNHWTRLTQCWLQKVTLSNKPSQETITSWKQLVIPTFGPCALSCWEKKKKQRVCSFTNAQRLTNSKCTFHMAKRQILSGRSSPEQRMNMAVVMREKWRLKMVMETSMISANTSAMTALSPTAVTAPSNTEWRTDFNWEDWPEDEFDNSSHSSALKRQIFPRWSDKSDQILF